jgi:hypothetical protein
VKLDPGESVVLDLHAEAPNSFVAPSPSHARCGYENNVEILDPEGGSHWNTDAGDDIAKIKAKFSPYELHGKYFCIPVTNLSIAKSMGACAGTAGGVNCSFTITVANGGPNAHYGPIAVSDTLFDGANVGPSKSSFSAPWTCESQSAAGRPAQSVCTYPSAKLDPGQKVVLNLEAEAPNSFVVPSASQARCSYKNKVEILEPAGGSDGNLEAGDDTAFGEAKFPPFEKEGRTYCGPPTNLAIAKTAGACATTASGQNCGFTITVTNKGPNAYKGPIEIRDTLFDGKTVEPSNGSWSTPWTCEGQSAAGHPEQRVCTHPPLKLEPGDSVALDLQVEAPIRFVVPSGSKARCDYTNKVEILDPAGGSSGNANTNDDTDSATTKFAPFEMNGKPFCGFVLTPPPVKPAEKKICPANSVGEYPDCRCPAGFMGTPPDCRKIAVPEACKGGMERIDGECQCPASLKWDGKRCAAETPKDCAADSVGKYPDCRCKRGTEGRPGSCVRIIEPKKCPADSRGVYPNCRCKRGTIGEPGNCFRNIKSRRCPEGFRGSPPNCRRAS